jgi:hypothetical protein
MRCRVPWCSHEAASRWSRYCDSHKSRDRRHGDPLQETITTANLKPYVKMVRQRIERNQEKPVWPILENLWSSLVHECRSYFATGGGRLPYERTQRRAYQEVIKIADHVEPRTVVETVLAMYLMLDQDPRRFRSDQSFRFQLVRRVRGLTDVNAGQWYDHGSGRVKRAYRDLPPRTAKFLGTMLAKTLGGAGVYLANLERKQLEQQRSTMRALGEALADVE